MEREVHAILGPVGVDEKLSRQVALNLLNLEVSDQGHGINGGSEGNSSGDEESNGLRWSKDVGISAFLLKFGEGMGMLQFLTSVEDALTVGSFEQRRFLRNAFTSLHSRSEWVTLLED